MYAAWRAAYRPSTWHEQGGARAAWLASLAQIAGQNTMVTARWWGRLNAYSDLSPAQFAATVLMNRANATAATTAATKAATKAAGTKSRKLMARGATSTPPALPTSINWAAAGKGAHGGWVRLGCLRGACLV